MRKEFTIGNVVEIIDGESPPTPTDKDHDAVWWNTDFGKMVKNAFQETKERMINTIEQMTEY